MEGTTLLCWLAVATASISFTITKTQTFDFIKAKIPEKWEMLFELVNCPYCVSHYVAAFFVAIYLPMPFTGHWVDLIGSVFIIVTLSTLIVQAILLVARILNVLKPHDPTA